MKKLTKKMVEQQYKKTSNLEARAYLNKKFAVKKKNKLYWYKWVFSHINFPKNAKVLELGCGFGNLWTNNKGKIPKDAAIILSDFSRQMLNKTEENVSKINHKFHFQLIDVDKIPYDDETFDIVIANHLLYLLPDFNKALKEICRVIKSGGIFVASTNSKRYMKELEDLLRKSKLPVHLQYTKCPFSLENGKKFLLKYFSKIRILFDSEGILKVTEAKPLADYILSTNENLNNLQKQRVRDFFQDYFINHKELIIRKISGVFIAKK